MIFWLDAQLPPSLAPWLTQAFGVEAYSLRYIGLRTAEDGDIVDHEKSGSDPNGTTLRAPCHAYVVY